MQRASPVPPQQFPMGGVLTKPKKKALQMQGFHLVPKGGLEPPHYH